MFGTEESLGYLAGTYARDKDAAVAALYALELAAAVAGLGGVNPGALLLPPAAPRGVLQCLVRHQVFLGVDLGAARRT